MSDQETNRAYPLAGICKKCHKLGFGYLLYGVMGRFICYRCAQEQAEATGPVPASTQPTSTYFTWTTTTSSTSTSSNTDYAGSNSK